jgi:hypothetical protein
LYTSVMSVPAELAAFDHTEQPTIEPSRSATQGAALRAKVVVLGPDVPPTSLRVNGPTTA